MIKSVGEFLEDTLPDFGRVCTYIFWANWCACLTDQCMYTVYDKSRYHIHFGDFKVGVSVGVYCTKCTLNTGVNTNFEITHCLNHTKIGPKN
jgi:hypothetical protein